MKFFKGIFSIGAASVAAFCCFSCVKADDTLGQDFIPASHIWQVVNTSLDIRDIEAAKTEDLGGYSSRRMSVGGVSEDGGVWNGRAAAFTLIPIVDTAKFDMGDVQEIYAFHFAAARDTVSFRDESQEHIIQNIRVYELQKPLGTDILYAGKGNEGLYDESKGVITRGIPTYSGGDSLSFDFTKEFAQKYVDALKGRKSWSMEEYTKELPGVCIVADRPVSGSGRINMFEVAVSTNDYGYLTGNYVEMKVRSVFDKERGPVDTSFVFMAGAASFIGENTSTLPTQYAFNICRREGADVSGDEEIAVEGGCGYKPVVRAKGLKSAVEDAVRASMIERFDSINEEFKAKTDAEKTDIVNKIIEEGRIVVNKATIRLPYKVSSDYEEVRHYPLMLSPTCRLVGKRTVSGEDGEDVEQEIVSYAGLTDASVSSENQGDINRSLDCYQPDVSHHIQELLRLAPKDGESDEDYRKRESQYDIWMLIMHSETNKAASSSNNSSYNDYLSALAYSSYYNSLYNGYGGYGYGGYGYGYGSYGYGGYYNNYYNYMMMAAYASQSSSTSTSTSTELDKDRYYNCRLYGPGSSDKKPTMTITYSFPTE